VVNTQLEPYTMSQVAQLSRDVDQVGQVTIK